jgi:hypothetical protein
MRGLVLMGIALGFSVAGAAALSRAIGPTDSFSSTPRNGAQSIEPTPPSEDNGASPSPTGSSQQLWDGLTQALRASDRAVSHGKSDDSDPPGAAFDRNRVLAGSADDTGGLGAQIDEAKKVVPEKPAGTLELENELVGVWKEQKEILAGQRDTVDSVMSAAH